LSRWGRRKKQRNREGDNKGKRYPGRRKRGRMIPVSLLVGKESTRATK
jgi:hypothetical protein